MTRELEEVAAHTLRLLTGLRMPEALAGNLAELREALADRTAHPHVLDTGPLLAEATLELSLGAYERACLERALRETGGNAIAAGRLLGIGKSTMYRKVKIHRLR